ncbi:hypothetical protein ACA910_010347 [Epithemia clementina (nom. ined.)]
MSWKDATMDNDDIEEDDLEKKLPAKRNFEEISTDEGHLTQTTEQCCLENFYNNQDLSSDIAYQAPKDDVVSNLCGAISEQIMHTTNLEMEIWNLWKTVSRLKQEKEVLQSNIASYWPIHSDDTLPNSGIVKPKGDSISVTAKDCVRSATDCVSILRSYNIDGRKDSFVKQICSQICNILWDDDIFGGKLLETHVSKARTWLSTHGFAPPP